ncbi:MAG: transglutaminase family protein [Pseudomonadota bacterium]
MSEFDDLRFKHDFMAFAQQPTDVLEGALLVSRLVEPDLDAEWCRQELGALAARVGMGADAPTIVSTLKAEGFRGSDQYRLLQNSSLAHVLRTHEGIPISLAMVVLSVAKDIGLAGHGINFPGHFMVEVEATLIDPLAMDLVDELARRRWLKKVKRSDSEAFVVASPLATVVRMLNNLSGLALGEKDFEGALEFSGYKRLLAPRDLGIIIERAQIWFAAGGKDAARDTLKTALGLAPNDMVRAQIEQQIAELESSGRTLH